MISKAIKQKIQEFSEEYLLKEESGLIKININALLKSISPETILFEMIKDFGFSFSNTTDIISTLNRTSGKRFFSETHEILKDREFIIIKELEGKEFMENEFLIEKEQVEITVPLKIRISYLKNDTDFQLKKEKSIAQLDADLLNYPLIQLR